MGKLALLWRGDRQARNDATPRNNRFVRVFEALAERGIHAEPAVYAEEMADEVREQLLAADGVLVWVNPISDGRTRVALDMGEGKVIGFGHQLIKGLIEPPPEGPDSEAARPGPRIMHPKSAPAFQALRTKMEEEWTPQMRELLSIDPGSLPIIWDADFLYGPPTPTGEDSYVLCEINVSSVAPFPDQAPEEIARLASARLLSSRKSRRTRAWQAPAEET
jgi:hypothetical protein